MEEEAFITKEYQEAFRKYSKDGVIDLDNKLKVKFNFRVHRLIDFIDPETRWVPPQRQSMYLIVLLLKGTGEKSIGHFTFPIHKNTLYIIPQRVIHSTRYFTPDSDGYVVAFNLEFFLQNEFPKRHIVNRKIFKCSIRPYINLTDKQASVITPIFDFILSEFRQHATDKNEMIAVKIIELLMTCDRFFSDIPERVLGEIYCAFTEKFTDLVERFFRKHRTVGFYAKTMHMHPNHLNLKVKNHTGFTAKQVIINYIILEAKALLASTSLTVKEIAFELGFEHPEHFYSLFKKHELLSPAQYRLNIH